MRSRALLALLLAAGPALACSPMEAQPPLASRIERVYASRCGSCHMRVERGEKTRDELTRALGRHHRRLRLTDEEWAKMADYLAPAATN